MSVTHRPPSFVPRYVVESREGWARGPRDLSAQLRTIRWHRGSGTAMALRAWVLATSSSRSRTRALPIGDLRSVHPITPGDAQLAARLRALEPIREQVMREGTLTLETQMKHLASKNPLLVVEDLEGRFYVLDGNLRLKCLRETFPLGVLVEVRHLDAPQAQVTRLLQRLVSLRHSGESGWDLGHKAT